MGSLPISVQSPSDYSFPKNRLKTTQNEPSKDPLVLVACGSFSPVTTLHLQMFEMASEFIKSTTQFEIMGGYLSPVSDAYNKQGLASAVHRLRMCDLAVNEKSDSWLMVDPWEALQPKYTLTAEVLDHFGHEINDNLGGAMKPDGSRVPVKIMMLAGADLIETMSLPRIWSHEDLQCILGDYGAFVVSRKGTDIEEALKSLKKWKENIYVFEPPSMNDTSSTKVRAYVKKRQSIGNLTPDPVIGYIEEHGLYQKDEISPKMADEG
ncbi:Nicotinate-nucleotide adenylyltransferase 1 [Hyphodiscus hymeniophilus]|uniref:Nicotinamide-nucleotide adenylyltransferase n=1 Tax=Hyphodiscus hymeniophilus TaxID=353542 RepID=A0A9P6VPC5_9HELO|nr:Nicotinate-nucleotide adenylyltransferase 1 [Hyphodiscus hymeniophilus]